MLATIVHSRHQLIINELDGAKGTHSQTGPHRTNPKVVGPLENAPSISGSDEDELDLLKEDGYECMLSARQAKKWADSLICTPTTQPIKSPSIPTTQPIKSPRRPTKLKVTSLKKSTNFQQRSPSTKSPPTAQVTSTFKIKELVNPKPIFDSLGSLLTMDFSTYLKSSEAASSNPPTSQPSLSRPLISQLTPSNPTLSQPSLPHLNPSDPTPSQPSSS